MSFFNSIFSAILSFFMLLFPWLQPGASYQPQIIEVSGIVSSSDTAYKTGSGFVLSDYCDLEDYWPLSGNSKVEDYDLLYFSDRSLAIVEVELADSSCRIELESVIEEGNTVTVSFTYVDEGVKAQRGTKYNVIVIPVGKNITRVSIDADAFELCGLKRVGKGNYSNPVIYSRYRDWKKTSMAEYQFPYYTERFFDEYSLAYFTIKDENFYDVRILSTAEEGNVLKVKYELVNASNVDSGANHSESFLISVSKNIKSVSTERIIKD